jgi:hypothetical protein
MSELVAVVDRPESRGRLEVVAGAVAELLGDRVRSVVLAPSEPDPVAKLVELLGEEQVDAVVLSGSVSDATLWQFLWAAPKPVVVVPPGARHPAAAIRTVLLPMDGSTESATAVASVIERLATGTRVTATHVFADDRVPVFWDQIAHAPRAWAEEFVRRHLPPGTTVNLRRGEPAEEVLAEADQCAADLIILGWKQQAGYGRAPLVHSALRGCVPVLLVAVGSSARPAVPGLSALPAGDHPSAS